MVGPILSESEATSSLIEQLLTLARADAHTEALNVEALDLRAIIQDIDSGSGALAQARGVDWATDFQLCLSSSLETGCIFDGFSQQQLAVSRSCNRLYTVCALTA